MSEQNLDAFAANPLDPDFDVDKLLGGIDGDQPDDSQAADTPDPDDKEDAKAGTKDEEQAKAGDESETNDDVKGGTSTATGEEPDPEQVVLSKDGKHQIPYAVLASERDKRLRAEQMVQELSAKLEADKHAAETGETVKTPEVEDIIDAATMTELEEDSPSVAAVIKSLIKQNQNLKEQHSQHTPVIEDIRREREIQSKLTVEEAIESIPKLAHVRETDAATFNAIADIDTFLRGKSLWASKPMAERFKAAVAMYEASNGEITLPGKQPAKAAVVDENEAVKAALAKAEKAAAAPTTLSDLPGGSPAPGSERESVEQMSGTALTNKLMNMTPDEQEAFLARVL